MHSRIIPPHRQTIFPSAVPTVYVLLLGLLVALVPRPGYARSARLTWQANPENNIVNYNIYIATNSGVYFQYTTVTNVGLVTNAVISGLIEGTTYYFGVTAVNDLGLEGPPVEEVSLYIPLQPGFTFPIDTVRVQTNDGVSSINFSLSGPVGRYFIIQNSTDLVHWVSVSTNLFTNSSVNLRFVQPVPPPRNRFYRSLLF